MGKIRVFNKADGSGVLYSYCGDENPDECSYPDITNGLEYIDIDESEAPESNSDTDKYHERIYFDGVVTKENLKADDSWDNILMPDWLIKKKYRDGYLKRLLEKTDLTEKIDGLIEYIDNLNQYAGQGNLSDTWLNVAVGGLDEKISKGENDKPVIRQKLLDKINDLKSK